MGNSIKEFMMWLYMYQSPIYVIHKGLTDCFYIYKVCVCVFFTYSKEFKAKCDSFDFIVAKWIPRDVENGYTYETK